VAWSAEGAEQGVDGFVGADADEEVGGVQVFGCVRVGVAEVAEELLEFVLVAGGLSVGLDRVEAPTRGRLHTDLDSDLVLEGRSRGLGRAH